ncbi:MAG: hypothetical protein M1819_002816 [Sarea resinae]|nr:MAG: hypothetical protein M1819_002816 [Sarea resinae]
MNDDPSTTIPALSDDANRIADVEGIALDHEASSSATTSSVSWRRQRRRARRLVENKKRTEFLDDMLRNFDILIYCQLSVLYYMDCSLFRFFIRAFIQFLYLTPKPPIFPDPPRNRPYAGAILGSNVLCLLLHIFLARPEAGEATRGYLHGGLVMDFVGQEGPISKFRLASFDILVLILQIVMLAAFIERRKVNDVTTRIGPATANTSAATSTSPSNNNNDPNQDHDAEERGVHRVSLPPITTTATTAATEDIELQPLRSSSISPRPSSPGTGGITDELLSETPENSSSRRLRDHPLDVFHSGEAIVTDLHLLDTLRTQWWAYENDPSTGMSSSSSTSSAALAAGLAGRRFRLRFGGAAAR